MNPDDDLKRAWQAQPPARLTIDSELLLNELRRNQRTFAAVIWLRDVREVGVAVVLLPVWVWMGIRLSLPWTWYLTIPGLVWVAAYLLLDRRRHPSPPPGSGESLRQRAAASLAQVEHQIALLRGVLWWYLLPLAVPMLIFFLHVGWRAGNFLPLVPLVAVGLMVFGLVYWVNQHAVRAELEPRRQELAKLLASLDETPSA